MAFRMRMIATIKYGHAGEYLKNMQRLNEVGIARGWAPMRTWMPVVGPNNLVIHEQDYPDLATYQRENAAFYEDEEAFGLFRANAGNVIEGSAYTEMLEDAPTVP